jgi:histidinol-phosphate aminotransferase
MVDPLNKIKPQVRALRAYTLSPDRGTVKLNQNENPWDAPGAIKEETRKRLRERSWSRYPDFVPSSLHEHLAEFARWKSDGIVAGNGSNELIQALLMVTVSESKRVLICEPTFALYRQITTILGGQIQSVPLTSDFRFDRAAILSALKESAPDVTIICSPNNPTGSVLSDDELEALLEASPGLIVVDEAYHEFARHTVVPLLSRHPNLVVMRTFSKAMALAALRVGYLLAEPGLAREISKAVLPYNLNAISQMAAEVAVEKYEAELLPLVMKIVSERDRLFEALNEITGIKPKCSAANFMIVRSSIAPKRVFQELLRRDILIRDVSAYPMLSEYFRVSVGSTEENDFLITALQEIFSQPRV